MRKRVINFLFAVLLLCMTSVSVLAHEVPNSERNGSITVHFEEEGKKLSSGTLTFYRVGEIVSTNGDYHFRLVEAFADCGESLKDISSPELAKSLLEFAQKKNLSGNTMKIHEGTVRYEVATDQLGLYLVAQHEAVTGYNSVDPFLIAVPNWDGGTYVYDVNATPKMGNMTAVTPTVPPTIPPKDPVLPQTGQHKLPIPVLAVLGLVLIGSGVMLRVGTKNKENET